jgi:hypothetical protein
MAFLGALGRVREEDSPRRFLIKGGIACELRFQNQARATRDIDALFHGSLDELLIQASSLRQLSQRGSDPSSSATSQHWWNGSFCGPAPAPR